MDVEKTIQFLLDHQARFSVDVERLRESVCQLEQNVASLGAYIREVAAHRQEWRQETAE